MEFLTMKLLQKKKKKIRVAIFVDTYFAGYDYGYNTSFQKLLRSKFIIMIQILRYYFVSKKL